MFGFQWHITDNCDQRCKHCYIFNAPCNQLCSMDYEDMRTVVNKCLEFGQKIGQEISFAITGGDPLLNNDFWRLADLLCDKKIRWRVLGNPYHLNMITAQHLSDCCCESYQVSLDGMKETHDMFRREGSFKQTLEAVPAIISAGMLCVIMTTVSDKNIQEVPAIVDLIGGLGYLYKPCSLRFAFARYCPTGQDRTNGIDPQEYRELLRICDEKFSYYTATGSTVVWNKKDHLWKLYDFEKQGVQINSFLPDNVVIDGCHCGRTHLTILPNGDVMACRRVQGSTIGNIFKDDLTGLWTGKMDEYRQYSNFFKCRRCNFKAFCRGCPAVAAGYGRGYYGTDPQCWRRM